MKKITLKTGEHGAFFILVITLVLQCHLLGLILGISARKDHLDFETLNKFKTIHESEIGKDRKVDKLGYPDNGNGKFSKSLPFRNWYLLNAKMRKHFNFLEMIIGFLPILLFAGIKYPTLCSYCTFIIIVSRFCSLIGDDFYKDRETTGENILKFAAWAMSSCAHFTVIAFAVKSSLEI